MQVLEQAPGQGQEQEQEMAPEQEQEMAPVLAPGLALAQEQELHS